MAKRTPRSEKDPNTGTGAGEAAPRKKAASGARPKREVASELAGGQDQAAGLSDNFVGVPNSGEEPVQAESTESTSMSSGPSEEDIRMRAYHRYLERGGGHGMAYDDWLEAERDLKNKR